MTITLTESQLNELADAVEARIEARRVKKARKPLTVSQFAEATGLSTDSVYRQLKAGRIRRVKGIGKKLIPASELDKFQ